MRKPKRKKYDIVVNMDGDTEHVEVKKKQNFNKVFFQTLVLLQMDYVKGTYVIIEQLLFRKSDRYRLPEFVKDVVILCNHIRENFEAGQTPWIFDPVIEGEHYRVYPHLVYDESKAISGAYSHNGFTVYFRMPAEDDELEIALTKHPIDDLISGLNCNCKPRDLNLTDELNAVKRRVEKKSLNIKYNKNANTNI